MKMLEPEIKIVSAGPADRTCTGSDDKQRFQVHIIGFEQLQN